MSNNRLCFKVRMKYVRFAKVFSKNKCHSSEVMYVVNCNVILSLRNQIVIIISML